MAKQYKISITVLSALVALGIVMQALFGGFDIRLLSWPVNLIAAALLLLAVAGLALYREKAAFGLLSGIPFSVSVITALLLCCLVMGLVPQREGHRGGGLLTGVVSSWPFIFIYLALLLSLGCVVARGFISFSRKRWAFYMNHLGLWLVLAGAGLGSADLRELTVKIPEGGTAEHGLTGRSIPQELPFAVRLNDFRMEEYPVRWGVVDIRTNRFQPEKRPVYYDTEAEAFARNPSPGTHERIASTRPEPKSFTSDVTVTLPGGREERAAVEVNRPYRRGSWTLYQSGYDVAAGPDSGYSVLKAVRDPWLPAVYAGIAMLAIGAVSMLLGRNVKNKSDELG